MDIKIFSDLFEIGLHPLPIFWDIEKKTATGYPEHVTDVQSGNGKHDLNDVKRWLQNITNANGIALKLYPPFFMFDFDLKNTTDKTVFDHWLKKVNATNSDVLSKLCIEKTRSGGYHVYAKFSQVSHKKMLAASEDGKEVISIYTGGLLSFCYPTPEYNLIHNDFTDIEELTQDEFDLLTACGLFFNKYTPKDGEYVPGEVIDYPIEYESIAMQFDNKCTDDLFEKLLNTLELFPVKDQRAKRVKDGATYFFYLRKGSVAAYSAKARFDKKRLFIFSGSFIKFPNFHTRINEADKSWRLTPTKIIFYYFDKDWGKTIDTIRELSEEYKIELVETSKAKQPIQDRLKFPYDIFPESVQQYIFCQSIQHEYLAAAILSAISTTIGNSVVLYPMPGYRVKSILYMAIVAPPGASKTPAINKAFEPIERIDQKMFEEYEAKMIDYKKLLTEYEQNKKSGGEKPEQPFFPQTLIKDSTIEMVAKILTFNKNGCCLLADELIGFLNRMNQYKQGDEIQKWLELWSGSSILIQRVTREANKIPDACCSILGGIQPGVVDAMGKDENQYNGFYHRFLFVYPEPWTKVEWKQIFVPESVQDSFYYLFESLYKLRSEDQMYYFLSDKANEIYKEWFDGKNKYYDKSDNDNVKGIIAKYQDYCLRFSLIIQVVTDGNKRSTIVTHLSMERAIRLTEYFLGNINKILKILSPESPADKLDPKWKAIYDELPENFTTKTIVTVSMAKGNSPAVTKVVLGRWTGKLVQKTNRGEYEKIF